MINFSPYSDYITVLAAQIPDAPVNLADVPAITDAEQIGLTWEAPSFDGGSSLLDYRIWYDNALGEDSFIVLVTVPDLTYTATGLVQGSTYKFKVEARNIYGYSAEFSNTVTILAA